jgi:hypothetical protein
LNSFDEVWEGIARDGSGDDSSWKVIEERLHSYAACGRDAQNRSILWVRGGGSIPVEMEKATIRTGVIYFTAIHADFISLRQGITFVLDTSSSDMVSDRVGNESKMQTGYQSMPLRPQRIFILGAGYIKRAIINALLSVASLFTKEKVIRRIRFAELNEVQQEIPRDALPSYIGGTFDRYSTNGELLGWLRGRLNAFPALPNDL